MRGAWAAYGDDARNEIDDARGRCQAAGAHDLDVVSATARDAASDLEDVLDVVLAVMDEHRGGMESCILDFENSDGNTAGAFNALTR